MAKRNVPKDTLIDLLDITQDDRYVLIQDEMAGTSRWSIIHQIVVHDTSDDTYWTTTYSYGATECQDESPFEFDPDEIEMVQVKPVEVVHTEYRAVEE